MNSGWTEVSWLEKASQGWSYLISYHWCRWEPALLVWLQTGISLPISNSCYFLILHPLKQKFLDFVSHRLREIQLSPLCLFSHSDRCLWRFTVVFICISLMTIDTGHLFLLTFSSHAYWPPYIFLSEMSLLVFCSLSNWIVWCFYCWVWGFFIYSIY